MSRFYLAAGSPRAFGHRMVYRFIPYPQHTLGSMHQVPPMSPKLPGCLGPAIIYLCTGAIFGLGLLYDYVQLNEEISICNAEGSF
ncbi:MAG: hypothetical protein HRU09_08705 [Oligoflexales bacterium]|nr:hypothetical protein [Oligoflexales bacterium]